MGLHLFMDRHPTVTTSNDRILRDTCYLAAWMVGGIFQLCLSGISGLVKLGAVAWEAQIKLIVVEMFIQRYDKGNNRGEM